MKATRVLVLPLAVLISCESSPGVITTFGGHAPATTTAPSAARRVETYTSQLHALAGAIIVAADGTYLGKVAGRFDSDSIANQYGDYGSRYSASSMFNQYGEYGSKYSNYSPFNKYASESPSIIIGDRVVGYVTVQSTVRGAVHPMVLRQIAEDLP